MEKRAFLMSYYYSVSQRYEYILVYATGVLEAKELAARQFVTDITQIHCETIGLN